jgi:hypothetical protein
VKLTRKLNALPAAGLLLGCNVDLSPEEFTTSAAAAPRASIASPLVYGQDDRKEYFEVPASIRTAIRQSVVALIPRDRLSTSGDVHASSLGEIAQLCDDEPYVHQPVAALCTGVLVDWDLVLTAGHCMRVLPLDQLVAVFDYYYSEPGKLRPDVGGALELQEVVSESLSVADAEMRLDYAWIRLKYAAIPPRKPLAIRNRLVEVGEGLVSIGAAFGVPFKIEAGGTVRDARATSGDYFVADSDTSAGSSGGPALDTDLNLAGILARGGTDLEVTEAGCARTVRVDEGAEAQEQFTYASSALKELCQVDPHASSLCRSTCGEPCGALPQIEAAAESGSCSTTVHARGATTTPMLATALLLAAGWRTRSRRA